MNPLDPPPKTGAEFLQRVRECGGRATTGPVDAEFQDGWAVHPFVGRGVSKAHYWTRVRELEPGEDGRPAFGVHSACGLETAVTGPVPLLGVGNYDPCARCDAAMLAYMRRTGKAIKRFR